MTWLKTLWCRWQHPAGYPIRGKYECPVCLRIWRIDWKVTNGKTTN